MNGRIWYPQLDVYDAVRRMALLMQAWGETAPVLERLYIADFYLANPPLLHRTSMPSEIREAFQQLRIPNPLKTFLSYPSGPILFHKMEPIQKKALQALVGRGVVDAAAARSGVARLSKLGREFIYTHLEEALSHTERNLIKFLSSQFATLGGHDTRELRVRTGLRRLS